ncbi:MAG TPA: Holliday junction branch migration protein RuvA [Tissierellaceae bacterium]|nr:Holliday junction branch migration protein RuvA [Tissierellaceae bacterium]
MFEYIIGNVVAIDDDYIVLQNNGIGYKIFTSTNSMMDLELGMKDALIYTYFNVREDGVYLYGFVTKEEINIYKMLLMVSKIGPKTAIGILSGLTPNDIKVAILRNDLPLLCKAPGVGKKTAERIVLELKDRIDMDDVDFVEEKKSRSSKSDDYEKAVDGLMSLGYRRFEIEKVLKRLDLSNMKLEELIREGLKKLSKN